MPVEVDFKLNAEALAKLGLATELAVNAVMLDVQAMAVELSPKDTGNNARSIDFTVEREGDKVSVELFTQSGYGGFLELGTSLMPARPYMLPAFELHRHRFAEEIRERLIR